MTDRNSESMEGWREGPVYGIIIVWARTLRRGQKSSIGVCQSSSSRRQQKRKITGLENFVYINILLMPFLPITFVEVELTLGLKDLTFLLLVF